MSLHDDIDELTTHFHEFVEIKPWPGNGDERINYPFPRIRGNQTLAR